MLYQGEIVGDAVDRSKSINLSGREGVQYTLGCAKGVNRPKSQTSSKEGQRKLSKAR